MKIRVAILRARLRRWWYLLTAGMANGECSEDHYMHGELIGLYSSRRDRGSWLDTHVRVWWRR